MKVKVDLLVDNKWNLLRNDIYVGQCSLFIRNRDSFAVSNKAYSVCVCKRALYSAKHIWLKVTKTSPVANIVSFVYKMSGVALLGI